MGRKVQIRASYQPDAAYLTRLAEAIEKDPKRDGRWKQEAISLINRVIVMFLDDQKATLKAKIG